MFYHYARNVYISGDLCLICSVQALEDDGMIMKGTVAHETIVRTYLQLMTLVQREIRTKEALMLELSAYQVEMVIEKQKRQKSRGIDQIPVHLIEAGDMTIRSEIHFDIFRIRRNCMRSGRSRSLCLFIRRAVKHCSNYRAIPHTIHKILSNILLLSRLTPYVEEIIGGGHRVF